MKKSLKWILIIAAIWLIIALVINSRETNLETVKATETEAPVEKSEIVYKNIVCKVVQKAPAYIRITTSEMPKDSDLLQIVSLMAVPNDLVYFHLPNYVGAWLGYG